MTATKKLREGGRRIDLAIDAETDKALDRLMAKGGKSATATIITLIRRAAARLA